MQIILKYLENVMDLRQEKKVLHKMGDIIAIVFFASLANTSDWTEIHYFAVEHEIFLKKYLELSNGIPSHDTIQRVFAMVSPEFLQGFQKRWNELLSCNDGEKIKKILAIDGKSNEITAIPELLKDLNIKGHIITTDAMCTQKEIVKSIRKKRADYVLALFSGGRKSYN